MNSINSNLNELIYKIIRAYQIRPTMFNSSGDIVYYPEEATRFYLKRENVMVTVDEDNVTVNKGNVISYKKLEPLIKQINNIAIDHNAEFSLKTLGRVIKAKDFSSKSEPVYTTESKNFSKAFGSTKTSYVKLNPKIKIIIKHSKNMIDRDNCRTMPFAISEMYLKNGYERVQLPCHLKSAKALARHVESGGSSTDKYSYIIMKTGEVILQLRELIKLFRKTKMYDELISAKLLKSKLENDLHALSRKTKYENEIDSFVNTYNNIDHIIDAGFENIELSHSFEEYHTCCNAMTLLDTFITNRATLCDQCIDYIHRLKQNDSVLSDIGFDVLQFDSNEDKGIYMIDCILENDKECDSEVKDYLSVLRKMLNKRINLDKYSNKVFSELCV